MRIALTVSGGDSTGINNFIFQIAKLTNAEITIFNGGINGLLENNHTVVSYRDLLDFSTSSMPIISAGRTERNLKESEYLQIVKNLKSNKIDLLILAGGDGSMLFLKALTDYGVNCFGVGMTIDNDIEGSQYTIGFSTACEQVLKEVAKLRNTGRALPNRVFMVEVLGAYCGELTLQSAIKSNADFALIPEHQIPIRELARKVNDKLTTQNSVVILCSESYTDEYVSGFQGAIDTVIKKLEPLISVRIRKSIMGFSLRNGDPTTEEIYQSTSLANELVHCINSGMVNKAIVINYANKPIPIDLDSVKSRRVDIDGHYFNLARELKII
ncbi:6-phosphofructokinase [Vibrio sp. DW001]|uniref:6-phosphofructokinase n=1 Tax=Vibrio sp. DW001 TaxID=2912315 RepID=UPI0023B17E22|nr:6-phosphofructokinase [Vibrio sp. DW001]WED25935.1 6-phosphofructokinase [Vibrio sp. DW001]